MQSFRPHSEIRCHRDGKKIEFVCWLIESNTGGQLTQVSHKMEVKQCMKWRNKEWEVLHHGVHCAVCTRTRVLF